MRFIIAGLKLFIRVIGFINGDRYRFSQPGEGNFKYMDFQEKLRWGYKAIVKQVENAEAGKGIEEYFTSQDLSFTTSNRLIIENKLTITAGGDLSPSEVININSTEHLWDEIGDFYFSGDIVCANLEAPLDPSKPESAIPLICFAAPRLNTSVEMFERYVLGGKGINLFATANNHALDQGEAGLIATLDFLDSKGYRHVGTSRTPEEQTEIPVIEKNGIRVAFLSYTYSLNKYDPIPGKEYLTNVVRLNRSDSDLSLIKKHIKVAHAKKADLIVTMLHWSIEFEMYPVGEVIKMGRRIMECGVDIILGGHPHVSQPMEKYPFYDPSSKRLKEGLIVFSLGELVSFNSLSKNSKFSTVIKIEISKDRDGNVAKTRISDLKVLPFYIRLKKVKKGVYDYRLLNLRRIIKQMQNGQNPYHFSTKEAKELERLDNLLFTKILPKKCAHLLME